MVTSSTIPDCPAGQPPRTPAAVNRPLVVLLALACGLTVANTYYAQPLLDAIARDLRIGSAAAGLVVTLGQMVPRNASAPSD